MILSVAFPTWKVRGSNDGCFFPVHKEDLPKLRNFCFFLLFFVNLNEFLFQLVAENQPESNL